VSQRLCQLDQLAILLASRAFDRKLRSADMRLMIGRSISIQAAIPVAIAMIKLIGQGAAPLSLMT
jgi:hypothetical protein